MTDQGKPESFLGALFAFVGLMLVVGVGVAIYGLRVQSADSRGLYEDLILEDAVLPYDFELVGGTAVAGKQRWIRFESAAQAERDPMLPEAVLIGRYPGPVAVRRQFETGRMPSGDTLAAREREWREAPAKKAFTGLLERGVLAFGPFETDFVRLRDFLPSGEFYDLVRIDLSVPGKSQLLVGHWPLGSEVSNEEALLPFLDVVRLPTPDELTR